MTPLEELERLAEAEEAARLALKEAVKRAASLGIPKAKIARAAKVSRPTVISWVGEDS
ncbi:hypothetical protein [Propionimicrobium lymphophilum]|uniref:hypothetical protein n=1 Tax=Propionimicrobium lymphophilum TaxID=33012 RepID=UPI0023EF5D98|nr:hypothetical protein [Propionimicrobium lymphophilum]